MMPTVYVIVGNSCAGKTSFTRNTLDIIDTEEVKDFTKFSMANLCGAKIEHLSEGDTK